jgi:hypothetical protein
LGFQFNLILQLALLKDRTRDTNPFGIADLDDLGFHGDSCNYFVITLGERAGTVKWRIFTNPF